jgi:uncharacterized protein YndB with AHSA1/START domain
MTEHAAETTAPSPAVLVVERDLPHPAEKVWRALTQGALLEDWLMPNDFEPVVGRRFSFRTQPMPHWDGVVAGEVLAAEPPKRLSYSWVGGGLDTVVAWTLTAIDGGVRLRMEQSGFGPGAGRFYEGARYGWTRNLERMAERLATLD